MWSILAFRLVGVKTRPEDEIHISSSPHVYFGAHTDVYAFPPTYSQITIYATVKVTKFRDEGQALFELSQKQTLVYHLSALPSCYDRCERYLLSAVKIPFVNYNSYEFALLVGPLFSAFNAIAGLTISSVGDAQPVAVSASRATDI